MAILGGQGKHAQAVTVLTSALTVFRADDHVRGAAATLTAIGRALAGLDDIDRAIALHHDAITMVADLNDPDQEGERWYALASAYQRRGDLEQAVASQERAISLFRQASSRTHEASSLVSLGDTYVRIKDHDSAYKLYDGALAILDELRLPAAVDVRARLSGLRWRPWSDLSGMGR